MRPASRTRNFASRVRSLRVLKLSKASSQLVIQLLMLRASRGPVNAGQREFMLKSSSLRLRGRGVNGELGVDGGGTAGSAGGTIVG